MATLTAFAIQRHVERLPKEETAEVAEVVADLVVKFLKAKCDPGQPARSEQEQTYERSAAQQPQAR